MKTLLKFEDILNHILLESEREFESAVAIVQQRDRWLLGLSRAEDDRKSRWCHPGGGIKSGESPEKAAERECYEETGIRCKAVGKPFRDPQHKKVAFVHCKVTNFNQKINPNNEFSGIGFFTMQELRAIKPIYKNALKLIEKAKRR